MYIFTLHKGSLVLYCTSSPEIKMCCMITGLKLVHIGKKTLLLARVSFCFPKEGYSKLFQLSSGYTALSICLGKLKERFTVACFLLRSIFNLGLHKCPTNPSDRLSSVLNIAQIVNITVFNVCIYVIITYSFWPHMERVHPTLLICSLIANSSKQFQASDPCASACRTLHKTE